MSGAGFATLALLALAGCAAPAQIASLRVRPVAYGPADAELGGVRAVADVGGAAVVFADGAATVLSGGRVVAVDRSVPRWIAAGTIPAADGGGPWLVGVDGDGRVRRLLGKTRFEPVSERYGLTGEYVLGVATLGDGVAGFRLGSEMAVADGSAVTRYEVGPLAPFAGGGGRAALAGDPLRVFDAATKRVASFALPERATYVTVTPSGKLFAATPEAIWSDDGRSGDLRLRFEAQGERLHGLVASGERVWFADGPELGVVEEGGVRETRGAKISPAAELTGSPSGDVWTLAGGTLRRWAVADEAAPGWDQAIAPVVARACAGCHRAGGEAGVDLTTGASWEARRAEIRQRVVVDRTMPPTGNAVSEADRAAIRAWLDRYTSP